MSCEEIQGRLDDHVDGALAAAEAAAVASHLAGCEACRREESALRALLARAAALPEEIAPARDLWPGVAARLGEGADVRRASGPTWWGAAALAAAASVIAALGALVALRGGPTAPARPVGGTAVPAAAEANPGLAAAEGDYERATAELMAALDQQKGTLPPETLKTVEENLKTIDEALAQVRAALRTDPGNPQLARLLTSTHQKKVDALQRVVRLNRL